MTHDTPVPPPTVELDPAPTLRHNPDRDRYELWSGDELIGLAGYELTAGGDIVVLHTVVTEKFGRAGFARLLTVQLFEALEADGRQVIPVCTYVQRFVERFPQYRHMVLSS